MAAEVHMADAHGVRIAYEVRGAEREALPLVLVHGLGYGRWGWEPVADRFAEARPVVLLDNRGIGASDVPPGPYDAAQMATDVLAVLDDGGWDRVDLVGTSLGGMVAQEVAIAAPERIAHLVLVSTTPGGDSARPMPEVTQRLLARMPAMEPAQALRAAIANALGPGAERGIVDRILEHRLAAPQDPAGWQAQAAAGTTYDGGGRLAGLPIPTLIVHGRHDNVVDPGNATVLADLLGGAPIAWFDAAGHLLPWEEPEHFLASVTAFLDES